MEASDLSDMIPECSRKTGAGAWGGTAERCHLVIAPALVHVTTLALPCCQKG